jgi:hypothetical protein
MSQISSWLFPAVLRMQEAEAAFEQMKKHFGDAVVLQDPNSLDGAQKDPEAATAALEEFKSVLSSSAELGKPPDGLSTQPSSIRTRDNLTYAAMLVGRQRWAQR